MDYSIVQAMNYKSKGIEEQQVIYDIACQWGVKFFERVDQSPYLDIPDELKLILAVGKFHLGAHILECFYKHSLNFIEGTGQVDGEIIETLWSRLNHVSSTARAMSKPHRRDVLDDFMRDSNWKKLIDSSEFTSNTVRLVDIFNSVFEVKMLVRKWETCKTEVVNSKSAFEELSANLDEHLLQKWAVEERSALDQGGDAMAVYGVRLEEGQIGFYGMTLPMLTGCNSPNPL